MAGWGGGSCHILSLESGSCWECSRHWDMGQGTERSWGAPGPFLAQHKGEGLQELEGWIPRSSRWHLSHPHIPHAEPAKHPQPRRGPKPLRGPWAHPQPLARFSALLCRHGQLRGQRDAAERVARGGGRDPCAPHRQLPAAAGHLVPRWTENLPQQPHVSTPRIPLEPPGSPWNPPGTPQHPICISRCPHTKDVKLTLHRAETQGHAR